MPVRGWDGMGWLGAINSGSLPHQQSGTLLRSSYSAHDRAPEAPFPIYRVKRDVSLC